MSGSDPRREWRPFTCPNCGAREGKACYRPAAPPAPTSLLEKRIPELIDKLTHTYGLHETELHKLCREASSVQAEVREAIGAAEAKTP